jgi:hypothetical protein
MTRIGLGLLARSAMAEQNKSKNLNYSIQQGPPFYHVVAGGTLEEASNMALHRGFFPRTAGLVPRGRSHSLSKARMSRMHRMSIEIGFLCSGMYRKFLSDRSA